MEDLIENLIDRIKADVKRNGEAVIAKDDANILRCLRIDHWRLKKRFRDSHFNLMDYLERDRKASEVLRHGIGDTNNRRKQALEEMGLDTKKKREIENVSLLLYYVNLINGVDPFCSEKELGKLSKVDAVYFLAEERRTTDGAIVKKLQRAYTHLKKINQLPKELEGILPPNWPTA